MPNAKITRAVQGGAPPKQVKKAAAGIKAGQYTQKQVGKKVAKKRGYGI